MRACAELESSAASGRLADGPDLLPTVADEYRRARNELIAAAQPTEPARS
jgi:hypothetical protein